MHRTKAPYDIAPLTAATVPSVRNIRAVLNLAFNCYIPSGFAYQFTNWYKLLLLSRRGRFRASYGIRLGNWRGLAMRPPHLSNRWNCFHTWIPS